MNQHNAEASLAQEIFTLGVAEPFGQTPALGQVSGTVTRYHVALRPQDRLPYEGTDARTHAAFPDGFAPSYGSGLAFKGVSAAGALAFYALTDRGPNGDAPRVPAPSGKGMMDAKFFPAPSFVPTVGVIEVDAAGARLAASLPLMVRPNVAACGLPPHPPAAGGQGEAPLLDQLRLDPAGRAAFSEHGIDSEAVAWDSKREVLWVSDEYGPYLLRVDPVSGLVLDRYGPGSGLPPILAKRRLNRGMEGMAWDRHSDRVHAFLQSPVSDGQALYAVSGRREKVERYARFARWIEFDPDAGRTARMWAYPLDPAKYHEGCTGHAKLGDMEALGGGRFIVIEQGKGVDGRAFNHLMLVAAGQATDIGAPAFNPDSSDLEQSSMKAAPVRGADWSAVTPLQTRLLLDLNAIGWLADKAEGLALADAHTLAISSDNDFGLKTWLCHSDGRPADGIDITDLEATDQGALPGYDAWVGLGDALERPARLWLLRFAQPLAAY